MSGWRLPWRSVTTGMVLAAILGMAPGCTGDINSKPASGSSQGSSGMQSGNGPGVGAGGTAAALPAYAPGVLHRLTTKQYQNSVRDLLGNVEANAELEADAVVDGLSSIGAAQLAISRSASEKFERSASALAQAAFADPNARRALTACTPAGPSDGACATTFVQSFGRRIFRRPVTPEELFAYTTLATTVGGQTGDPWLGLELVLSGMLQSPSFLYRVELGSIEVGPGHRQLDDYELATRLSYVLLGTTPSAGLLDLAAGGNLSRPETLTEQARLMLADPRTSESVNDFFVEMFGVRDLARLTKSPSAFPAWSPSLAAAMDQEFRWLVRRHAFETGGSFLDVYEAPETYLNGELASLYGLSLPSDAPAQVVTLPELGPRRGLLMAGGFLARHAFEERTSATERGKAVRQQVLCQTVPPPPPDVVAQLSPVTSGGPQTARERLAGHATAPSCAACHNLMDPIGLALEHFDGIGRYRETDQGLAIDPSGVLDGVSYQDAAGLASAVRQHPDAAACVVRQLYRHATGHRESAAEEQLINDLTAAFTTGGERFPELVVHFVTSDAFSSVAPAP